MKSTKTMFAFAAVAAMASAWTASATITVTSGDIYSVDPNATGYGAVRFKDFANTELGRSGNIYLQDKQSNLGSGTGRVEGDPLWTVSPASPAPAINNSFTFEYRPVAGATDLVVAGATDRSTPGFQRVINDPQKTVNFISFLFQNNERTPATADTIVLNLTDLDGQSLTPGSVSWGYQPGGITKFYLTDPSLLANGFVLSGNIQLFGSLDKGETDKVEIEFGNFTPVPEPSTYLAGALLALPVLLNGVRKLRRCR